MFKFKPEQVVTDSNLKTQFEFAGAMRATYGNMDQDEIFVVDPSTKEVLGRPLEGVEYSMLSSGINKLSVKFYPNAMVTKDADDQMRDHAGMTGKRDWYDVTMLVRVSDQPENIETLEVTRGASTKPALPEGHSAEVVSLFGREPG